MQRPFLVLWTALIVAMAAILPVGAQEPLSDILRGELDYEFAQLSANASNSSAAPYYMSFRVTDTHRRAVSASFGVAAGAVDFRERVFKPLVRLGSPDFDNFREGSEGGRWSGKVLLPLGDDNPDAIRQTIWKDVEEEYKASVIELERLRAADRVNVAREDKAPDFSAAPIETYYEAPLTAGQTAFDTVEMERRVKAYSAVFLSAPGLLSGSATVDFTVSRRSSRCCRKN